MDSKKTPEIFEHGSAWVRADFHLHTRKDKEFNYQVRAHGHETNVMRLMSVRPYRIFAFHKYYDYQSGASIHKQP